MYEHIPKFTTSASYKCLENLRQQNFDLYLCYCGIQNCESCHSYGPTQRTEYLIHYILSGKGSYTIKGITYHLSAHQAFLIFPNETTFYMADKDDPWTYIWIGFNGAKAVTYLSYAMLDNAHRTFYFPHSDLLLEQVENMLNAKELTYCNELKRQSYLFLFLAHIIDYQHTTNTAETKYDYPYQIYVDHAVEYIENNYYKNIKIQCLANYIGISRSYLNSSFRKVLNTSPQNYLLIFRLEKACTLLKTTTLTINEIANRVGYDDSLAFSKLFKLHKGMSPKLYRLHNEELELSSEQFNMDRPITPEFGPQKNT